MITDRIKVRRIDFSPDEWLAGTTKLTLVEKGCYWTVCCLIYSKGGPVDDDPVWLARNMGCDVRTWKAVRERLLELGKLQLIPARPEVIAPHGTPKKGPTAPLKTGPRSAVSNHTAGDCGKPYGRGPQRRSVSGTFACGQLTNSRCEQELNKARTRTISARSAADLSAISRRSRRDRGRLS